GARPARHRGVRRAGVAGRAHRRRRRRRRRAGRRRGGADPAVVA
ncbi:MAG: hypothetical protein AVDCRST_MAG54-3454, partial [uncultured Actinomycetospora sp.]